MKKIFQRNLDNSGRFVRAAGGTVLVVCGIFVAENLWWRIGLIAFGAFMLFEAMRGWCIIRACGIKTLV